MAYNTLENFYKTQFALRHHHKWSLFEMNSEVPWEREVQIALLEQALQEEEERLREEGLIK